MIKIFNVIGTFLKKHNTAILTGASVAGVVATSVLATKATIKSVRQYDAELKRRNNEITFENPNAKDKYKANEIGQFTKLPIKDTIKLCWKNYIPVGITMAATIATDICSTKVADKKAAIATAAANIANQAYVELKDSINEVVTDPETRKKIESKAAEKKSIRESNEPAALVGTSNAIIYGQGPTLFKLAYNGVYFRSSVNKIDKAVNNLNYKMMYNNEMYASLSDFFDELGIRDLITPSSDQVGWNIDSRIETKKSKTGICEFTDEAYILVEFTADPTNNYQKVI